MLNQSIFTRFTGLFESHFPDIINHHKHLGYFMQLYNKMNAQTLALPIIL